MKKFLIVIAVILLLGVVGFMTLKNKLVAEVNAFDRTAIDISSIPDGIYEGSSETMLVKVNLKVTVADGKIDNIEIIKHECGKGLPANAIVDDMIKENTVEVDTVSGATFSSEVIKDAMRNALRNR